MLLSPFSSPRRLLLLAVFIFFAILVMIRNSHYSTYLPKYDNPKFTSGERPDTHRYDDKAAGHPSKPTAAPAAGSGSGSAPGAGAGAAPDAAPANEMWQPYVPEKAEEKKPADEWTYHESAPVPMESAEEEAKDKSAGADGAAPSAAVAIAAGQVVTPLTHAPHHETQSKIQQFIQWERPHTPGHWPGWDDYKDKDYDPNRWEGLPWENGYFEHNGIHQLEQDGVMPKPYMPYPNYNSREWMKEWDGEFKSCRGPRGDDLDVTSQEVIMAYPSRPHNFPNVSIGSAEVIGIDIDSCFDRNSRYYPFGANPNDQFQWSKVWWGKLQDECLERNGDRYHESARAPMQLAPQRSLPKGHEKLEPTATSTAEAASAETESVKKDKKHSRTAILIRTWEGYDYTQNDMQVIRALITETSLLSGGEYQVYLLVNVKEREADIYDNPKVYHDVLQRVVPDELRDISVLWTERVCEHWYPNVTDWQVYWMQFMPLQWFSKTHPEFDYVWNWETDARYTGNAYHFLEKLAAFSKAMPRKHLWERNARFYFPEEHGNYASFLADTDAAIDNATAAGDMTPVWGPLPGVPTQTPVGPAPPTHEADDEYSWGVGEDADLITLQPIWDPSHTEWSYRNKIWNFEPGVHPVFGPDSPADEGFFHQGYADLPRRVFINTVARFSKKMLHAMHIENFAGRSMQAEMWPATVALHHGLKAVYAPHPIWTDRKWPGWYMDAIFNADGGKPARWGMEMDSPYNHDREANFRGWSWYYASGFPSILYRRFLGWVVEDGGMGKLGGDVFEKEGALMGDGNIVGAKGPMCLPGMLLHPVKKVQPKEKDKDEHS